MILYFPYHLKIFLEDVIDVMMYEDSWTEQRVSEFVISIRSNRFSRDVTSLQIVMASREQIFPWVFFLPIREYVMVSYFYHLHQFRLTSIDHVYTSMLCSSSHVVIIGIQNIDRHYMNLAVRSTHSSLYYSWVKHFIVFSIGKIYMLIHRTICMQRVIQWSLWLRHSKFRRTLRKPLKFVFWTSPIHHYWYYLFYISSYLIYFCIT